MAQFIATGGDDNVINLWHLDDTKINKINTFSGPQNAVKSLIFDPREHKIVSGYQSGAIKVFDLETGQMSPALEGHLATTSSLDYHLYGDYVASGSVDTIVKVWDLRTKNCMQTFNGHSSEVTAVRFTPDGRWLTSGDQDGVIRIWDLMAGRLLREFRDHGGAITSLEFNPEEFILVSSAADRTIRFWDVQTLTVIGVTPVDNATTTSMCHTVAEPYSGKYLFCCSQDAIRVWSYETAIECHDSMPMPRQKGLVHADATMTQDMKLMSGCIQDAFVSIWILDVMQMQPFDRTVNGNNDQRAVKVSISPDRPSSANTVASSARTNQSVIRPTAVARSENMLSAPLPASCVLVHNVFDGDTRAATAVTGDEKSHDYSHQGSSNPTASGILVPLTEAKSISCQVRRTKHPSRRVSAQTGTPDDLAFQQQKEHSETYETGVHSLLPSSQQPGDDRVTSDFVMELHCGMDTCVKAFTDRQKYVQQLLVHWEKGRLNDGFRYISGLPKGKREAVVVDVLRITNLQSLDVDLEACVLLLPLIVEILESKFELYWSVGVECGHELFNAFSPAVKESRDVQQDRFQTMNLAAKEEKKNSTMQSV
ncbi:unnamed protein product [Peronospora belbahrii]|uniref:Katanin p80 subunit C-terminal domain-containing protein n=1 Tax=Peronospora belbahrii TaxID=622444 RepID=A0AAU9L6U9_9STRA|nr:unnamed protein product [Peronospora belbahrii]